MNRRFIHPILNQGEWLVGRDGELRQTVWSAGASLRKLARVAVAVVAAVEPQLRGGAGCLKVAGSDLMCTLGRWSQA
jgi:hypothetical protein